MALVVVDSFEFDTEVCRFPSVVQVNGTVYAIAYAGRDSGAMYSDGWLITVNVDNTGNITEPVIDDFKFDTASCYRGASIIHISGDVYAIAYHKTNSGGWVITVKIDGAGNITEPAIDSLQLFSRPVGTLDPLPYIIHISGNIYAILSSDALNREGFLYTVEINSVGNITDPAVDTHRFDASAGYYPEIIKVSGTTYAIVYEGCWLKTLTIANDGTIAVTPDLDSLNFDTASNAYGASIVHVTGDIYAIAYNGPDGDGWLATVEIDTAGVIADAVIDTLEFDTSSCTWPHIIQLSTRYYAIAYRRGSAGYLKTVTIESDGTIADSVTQNLFFNANCEGPFVFAISKKTPVLSNWGVVGVAFSGTGYDGWLKTIGGVEDPTTVTKGNPNIDQLIYQHVERMD